jgi:hypothetical protein
VGAGSTSADSTPVVADSTSADSASVVAGPTSGVAGRTSGVARPASGVADSTPVVADSTSGRSANVAPSGGSGAPAVPPTAEPHKAPEAHATPPPAAEAPDVGALPAPPPGPVPSEVANPSAAQGTARASSASAQLRSRWLDVVDHVQRRNTLLAAMVRSAEPLAVEDTVMVVAFSTELNRKSAERSTSRQLIESALERVYGARYRLRAVVADSGGGSLLDDPVINFAQRTFGGQPKRVPTE